MYTQNSFLTATVEPATTAETTDATATAEVVTEQPADATATAQTTDGTTAPDVTVSTDGTSTPEVTVETTDGTTATDVGSAISIDTAALQEVYNSLSDDAKAQIGPGGENITIDENGNLVVVNPETGATTLLSDLGVDMEQLQSIFSVESGTGTTVPTPTYKEMTGFSTAMYLGYAVVCVVLISLILSQKKRSAAFGNGMNNNNGQQSYWDKNKGRSKEGKIDLYTKIGIGVFMAFTFIIALM